MPSRTHPIPTTQGTPAHWKHEPHTSQPPEHHPIADQQLTRTQVGLEQAIHRTTCWLHPIPPTMTRLSARASPHSFPALAPFQNARPNPFRQSRTGWNLPLSVLCPKPKSRVNPFHQLSYPVLQSATAPPPPPFLATKRASGKPQPQKTGVTGTRQARNGEPTVLAGSSRSRLRS